MFGRPGHFKNGKSQIWAKFKKIIGPMIVLTIGTKNGRKICPWWAPGLGNHFGSKFTWILKKFNFCCRYQPNILKRAWDVAFGLNFHVEKSFLKNSRLFTFSDFFWIFSILSILTIPEVKICPFFNPEWYIMLKWRD